MSEDTIKLAGFGFLTKKLQENNVKIDEEELSSLFSDTLQNADNDSISADDFSKVLSNTYNINSSDVLDALEEIANSDGVDDLSLADFEKYQEKNVENSNQYINISSETIKNIPSSATIQTQDGEIKVSDYINSILSSTSSLTEQETKQYALNFLSQTLSQTKETYQTQKESEGIISSGYNFLKELTGLGTSDKDIEKQIANQEEMINALNDAMNGKGDLSFEETWKKYTGVDYSKEKMDAYLETSAKYQAIMVGCQYDENFMENFEKSTGASVNDVMKDFISSKQETFGKDFDLESTFEKYQQDQQTFTSKLSSVMSMAGLACTLASFVCPPAGAVLLPLGRTLQLSGMFIDNGLDLIDKATDKDGLTLSEAKDLGIDTGAEALGFLMGRKIGGFTNGLNNTVKTALGAKGVNNIVSTVAGQIAETTTDAALSLGTDYAIAQATSVAKTGEFLDSSQYWSVDRFLGEGRNQLIAILSGVAQGKVSKYQQTMVETAKAQVLMGDFDSARESLKNSGLKLADGDFDEFVEGVKMQDTLARQQTSQDDEILKSLSAESEKLPEAQKVDDVENTQDVADDASKNSNKQNLLNDETEKTSVVAASNLQKVSREEVENALEDFVQEMQENSWGWWDPEDNEELLKKLVSSSDDSTNLKLISLAKNLLHNGDKQFEYIDYILKRPSEIQDKLITMTDNLISNDCFRHYANWYGFDAFVRGVSESKIDFINKFCENKEEIDPDCFKTFFSRLEQGKIELPSLDSTLDVANTLSNFGAKVQNDKSNSLSDSDVAEIKANVFLQFLENHDSEVANTAVDFASLLVKNENIGADDINKMLNIVFVDSDSEFFKPYPQTSKTSKDTIISGMKFVEKAIDMGLTAAETTKIARNIDFEYREQSINTDIPLEKLRTIAAKITDSADISINAKSELLCQLFGVPSNISEMTLAKKMSCLNAMEEIKSSDLYLEAQDSFSGFSSKMTTIQNSINHIINPTDVSSESKKQMFKGFFANNDNNLDNLLSTADFTQYGKDGVPLEYSRSQFLQDLTDVLKTSTKTEQNEIFDKLGISVIKDETGKITGYDGVINLTKLSTEGTDGAVLSLVNRFIKENSVNTGDVEIDNALNSLIQGMPEFINVVGKQQHSTQDLSVDAHILTVLQQAMSNPNYQNLSNQDKFCLKLATIMHDISKAEGVVDADHPDVAALYARDILSKFNLSNEVKDRVCELIKNHHWLKEYNTGSISASQVAAQFRRTDDLAIAQIMAEADLKGVKIDGSFYEKFSSALTDESQAPIENALNAINSMGQMFLTNKVINQSKLPTVEYDEQEYKVVDLTSLSKDFDLSQFGFEPGTTPENMRIFVHMVRPEYDKTLETVYNLGDVANQGLLCASYVSVDNSHTCWELQFGVSLEADNVNIANATYKDQHSGRNKNFDDFADIITQQPILLEEGWLSFPKDNDSNFRNLISDSIKQELGLSDSEYSQLYSSIQKYKYTSQFDNIPEIKVGDKTFTGAQVKQAILNADELTIKNNPNRHNEANLYAPKVNAVVAKVSKLEDVPQELLAFAQEHNLPIYLLGN